MSKRNDILKLKKFLFLILIGVVGISSTGCNIAARTGNLDISKPNIIVVLTDDQPPNTLPFMPILNKELISKGVNFTNAYVTTPLCCPSRASILSGLFARHHNVLTDREPDGGASSFNDQSTIPVWLQKSGYRTGLFGKYLNETNLLPEGYVPPGWDDWQAFWGRDQDGSEPTYYNGYSLSENGKIVLYGNEEENYSTDLLTQKAINFIDKSGQQPFFVMLSVFAPHDPYNPAKRHRNLFKTDAEWQPYRPPNFYEEDISDKPDWMQLYQAPKLDYVFDSHQRILRSLQAVDESLAKIINVLESRGIRDNTMIIYLSDNGQSLGENQFWGKNCPYDACIHIPMIVSYPGIIKTARVDSSFVLNVDIAPTIAELSKSIIPNKIDGTSFLSLLKDPETAWRDGFMFEHFQETKQSDEGGSVALIPSFIAFRTAEWKYIEYTTDEIELYDLKNDPYENQNVAGISENAMIIEELAFRLYAIK